MAKDTIRIYANDPQKILNEVSELIRKEAKEGKGLKTWKEDMNGLYHTGDGNQWANEARLKFKVEEYESDGKKKKKAIGSIVLQSGRTKPDNVIRAIYLGRFSEVLITYFDNQMDYITLI